MQNSPEDAERIRDDYLGDTGRKDTGDVLQEKCVRDHYLSSLDVRDTAGSGISTDEYAPPCFVDYDQVCKEC